MPSTKNNSVSINKNIYVTENLLLEHSIVSCFKRLSRLDIKRRQLTPQRRSLINEEANELIERIQGSQTGSDEEEEQNEEDKDIEMELRFH